MKRKKCKQLLILICKNCLVNKMDYRFSQLFDWCSGKADTSTGGDIPIYGSNGVIGYTSTAKYYNKIILGRVGAYCGSVEYCAGPFSATDNTLITTCDESKILYQFAYYLLKHFRLNDFAGGSAQPLITQSILRHLHCNIPEISQQKFIANVLSSYDNLIENNNKRIAILEQMAENLYKEWFVRFRFPGHERVPFIDSPLGKIPSTFSVVKMNDVISYYIGGGWGNDERDQQYAVEASVIRGTDFPFVKKGDLSTCPLRYHKETNFATRQLKDGDIVLEVSGGTAEQPVGRTIVITKNILERFNHKAICASFCKLIRLNKDVISPHYFACWMDFLYAARIIDKFQLQSTGISNFQFEYFLRKGNVLLPPKNIMLEFEEHITRYKQLVDKLAQKNDNIIKQRDMLLPRLINGTLEIKL